MQKLKKPIQEPAKSEISEDGKSRDFKPSLDIRISSFIVDVLKANGEKSKRGSWWL